MAEPLSDYKWTECEIRTEVQVKVLTEEQTGKRQLSMKEQYNETPLTSEAKEGKHTY